MLNYAFIFLILTYLIINTKARDAYIINIKDKCKLPNYKALSPEALPYFYPQNFSSCTNKGLLSFTSINNNIATLFLNETSKLDYYGEKEATDCCFSYIHRNGTSDEPDVGISFSECHKFQHQVELKNHPIIVKCSKNDKIVYENTHYPIVLSKRQLAKIKTNDTNTKPISVLFIVIDSISRLNFIRQMPKTREYLLKKNFVELKGYNKIDDNTYPNFNALLTGLNFNQSDRICKPYEINIIDKCPMIWYTYKHLGYITAYAEDWTQINTYNYLKKGFYKPPTDFYFKPYLEATETLNTTIKDNMLYCTGPEPEGEKVLTLAKDFSSYLVNKPSFGIFWMNTFSHNYLNSPSGMDEKVTETFETLNDNGVLNDSVVILLSDHGIRFGGFRKTVQGYYEERLPMSLISLPPWFREQFPEETSYFYANADKLTSTYDLHMTLQHLLVLSGKTHAVKQSRACPNCMSLLKNIPYDRTCKDAGIPQRWCSCLGYFNVVETNSTLVKNATEVIKTKLGVTEYLFLPTPRILKSALSESFQNKSYLYVQVEIVPSIEYISLFKIKGEKFKLVDFKRAN